MSHGVADFLQEAGLGQYVDTFLEEGYDDMKILAEMADEDMAGCGLKPGHRLRLKVALRQAAQVGVAPSPAVKASKLPPARPAPTAGTVKPAPKAGTAKSPPTPGSAKPASTQVGQVPRPLPPWRLQEAQAPPASSTKRTATSSAGAGIFADSKHKQQPAPSHEEGPDRKKQRSAADRVAAVQAAFAQATQGAASNVEGKMLTVKFQPGKLGMSRGGLVITDVHPGGQAEKLGVQKGMKYHKLNGQPVSEALLHQYNDSGKSFEATFIAAAVPKGKGKKLTVMFQPGKLGMNRNGMWIEEVHPGGQAEKLGVQKGMKYCQLNGQGFSEALLNRCQASGKAFEATFTAADASEASSKGEPGRAKAQPSSTSEASPKGEAGHGKPRLCYEWVQGGRKHSACRHYRDKGWCAFAHGEHELDPGAQGSAAAGEKGAWKPCHGCGECGHKFKDCPMWWWIWDNMPVIITDYGGKGKGKAGKKKKAAEKGEKGQKGEKGEKGSEKNQKGSRQDEGKGGKGRMAETGSADKDLQACLERLGSSSVREHLIKALESIYWDRIKPMSYYVKGRLKQQSVPEPLVKSFLTLYEQHSDLFNVLQPRTPDDEACIYFVEEPEWFDGWVDIDSPDDPYDEEMWEEFSNYLEAGPEGGDSFPGGRYGMACELLKRDLSFLKYYSLGEVCHIVQLAIQHRKLIAYHQKMLKPVKTLMSQSPDGEPDTPGRTVVTHIDHLCLLVFRLLLRHPEGVLLSRMKQMISDEFACVISETAFQCTKLSELFSREPLSEAFELDTDDSGGVIYVRMGPSDAFSPHVDHLYNQAAKTA
eukprot:TRINITY_DN4965_c0_g1_i1.p1 TRINITY_DN4965_c0_g1~~TRINITY_DN4965_c0_g1_i1.p1  ORF type:complete len:815 (-),score=173.37 TRINITY_DN4965_c0_g1_i1:647-3091(-)